MDISAQNTFTPAIQRSAGRGFDVIIAGTFDATVTIQASRDGSTWIDLEDQTTPIVRTGLAASEMYYRVGVKTGNYTSGTVSVDLG